MYAMQSFPSVADHHLLPFTDVGDFGLSTYLPFAAASNLSNLVQTCAISEYDLGGEGDLFKAPRPILEEPVLAFDPTAAATILLSGYGSSSITTDNIEMVDMESIQNGDLLCEAFYGCEKDLLVKSARVPAPEVADFVLPSLQAEEETTVGERNCFSAEGPLQKTNASSVGPCLLDVREVDLEAAFGMRTYSEGGDIQSLGVDSYVHGDINTVPTFWLSSTIVDAKMKERIQKLSRYRTKRTRRNFHRRIKYVCRKVLADEQPRVRGRFAKKEGRCAKTEHSHACCSL
ncbi:CCT motif family protein [Musa troglodytarum]|uniref:CCT motif family protein n=1 Tax=Musa troglodytarum TaxID=320322 RepID=A0A9E7HM78_9LILI|nr:CCT motif family protein [Musa troglodytarum]